MEQIGDVSQNPSESLKLKDLGLSAYIFANGVKPLKTERIGEITYFYFPQKPTEKLVASYWNDNPPHLPARQLFAARRSLQDFIFSGVDQ